MIKQVIELFEQFDRIHWEILQIVTKHDFAQITVYKNTNYLPWAGDYYYHYYYSRANQSEEQASAHPLAAANKSKAKTKALH